MDYLHHQEDPTMAEQNYNQLVLAQLQALSQAIDGLRADLQVVRQEMVRIKAGEDRVTELREWKRNIDEVVSPTQLQNLVNQVNDLNNFKTKAITIFAVVQFAMAFLVMLSKVMG